MSEQVKIQPGKDEVAVVQRVVPGRLVYVSTAEGFGPSYNWLQIGPISNPKGQ